MKQMTEKNKRVSAYFLIQDDDVASRTDTKTKGIAYYQDEQTMIDDYEENMKLLFQINFEELPNLPGMPEKGILQIFFQDNMHYLNESGLYDESVIQVRYYETVKYEVPYVDISQEYPIVDEFEESEVFADVVPSKYMGGGAILETIGDCDWISLGNQDDMGIVFGGSVWEETIDGDNYQMIFNYPQYSYPLLRINSVSPKHWPGCRETYYFLVKPSELLKGKINKVLFLIERTEAI